MIAGISSYVQTGDIGQALEAGLVGAVVGTLVAAGGWYMVAGATVAGVYTASKTEADTKTKFVRGGITFASTLFWGSLGNSFTNALIDGIDRLVGELIFDLEFGAVAEMFNVGIQSTIKNAQPTKTVSKSTDAGYSGGMGGGKRVMTTK